MPHTAGRYSPSGHLASAVSCVTRSTHSTFVFAERFELPFPRVAIPSFPTNHKGWSFCMSGKLLRQQCRDSERCAAYRSHILHSRHSASAVSCVTRSIHSPFVFAEQFALPSPRVAIPSFLLWETIWKTIGNYSQNIGNYSQNIT